MRKKGSSIGESGTVKRKGCRFKSDLFFFFYLFKGEDYYGYYQFVSWI